MTTPATAKIFENGSAQAVRLPKSFQFEVDEVEILRRGDEVICANHARACPRQPEHVLGPGCSVNPACRPALRAACPHAAGGLETSVCLAATDRQEDAFPPPAHPVPSTGACYGLPSMVASLQFHPKADGFSITYTSVFQLSVRPAECSAVPIKTRDAPADVQFRP